MEDSFEDMVKKALMPREEEASVSGEHPGEEAMASFFDGLLSEGESARLRRHVCECNRCLELFSSLVVAQAASESVPPQALIERVQSLVERERSDALLDLCIRAQDGLLELLRATGDVLVGQEFIPAPVLRSREKTVFKGEITVLKDFAGLRAEVRLAQAAAGDFSLSLLVKDKKTQQPIPDARITLVKDDVELESCLAKTGAVIFERVTAGRYRVDITATEGRFASITIEITQ